jgi:hypothetical protein
MMIAACCKKKKSNCQRDYYSTPGWAILFSCVFSDSFKLRDDIRLQERIEFIERAGDIAIGIFLLEGVKEGLFGFHLLPGAVQVPPKSVSCSSARLIGNAKPG